MKRLNVIYFTVLGLLAFSASGEAGFKFFDSTLVDVVEVDNEVVEEVWETAYSYNNGKGAAKIRKSGRCKAAKLALERGFEFMQYEERDNEDWAVSEATATFMKRDRGEGSLPEDARIYELCKYVVLWECKGSERWARE